MADNTVGRLIQVRNGQGNPPPLEIAEFGFKTNTNQEGLYIGSNSGNIKIMTERDSSTVPLATTTNDGLLSKEDKGKINSVAFGANNTTIVNNLTSTSTTSALSAYQGKVLKDMIDAGGGGTIANIYQSGVTTSATGTAFGDATRATGDKSFAIGWASQARGLTAVAEGNACFAYGNHSHASGMVTESFNYASFSMGCASNMNAQGTDSYNSNADAFVIGNGTIVGNAINRSNAFRVKFDGSVYGRSAYNSSGADYAEYFEWSDGNIDNEDRVGYFVTLDRDKIRKANSSDTYILGIISATPSVLSDSASEGWNEQYVRDDFGRIQYHYVGVEHEELDENGEKINVIKNEYHPIYNPQFDSSLKYTPREDRPEWSPVGMMGKLLVRDDGTCEVNGYCSPNDEGIATKSDEGYRVMKRVADNIIQVLVK